MIILTLRTDKPESEIGLYENDKKIAYIKWEAHRQLAETLHTKIDELLSSQELSLSDIQGIVMFEGPGSFTGLRIGISVGNALAYSLQIPCVGSGSEDWQGEGINKILGNKQDNKYVLPVYGSEAHITVQKK